MSRKHRLGFPVLSDHGNEYARQLNLVHSFPDDLREVYLQFGIDLSASNGEGSWTLPLATRMVVDQDGIIRRIDSNPDYTRRPEPQETLATLAGL